MESSFTSNIDISFVRRITALPNEIISEILRNLRASAHIFALCCCGRRLNMLSVPYAYQVIKILSAQCLHRFSRTVLSLDRTHPYSEFVKKLLIRTDSYWLHTTIPLTELLSSLINLSTFAYLGVGQSSYYLNYNFLPRALAHIYIYDPFCYCNRLSTFSSYTSLLDPSTNPLQTLYLVLLDYEVSTSSLVQLIRASPMLQALSLSNSDEILPVLTDPILVALGESCPRLRYLSLELAVNITDSGLHALSHGCTYLEYVCLVHPSNLTAAGLSVLKYCKKVVLEDWAGEEIEFESCMVEYNRELPDEISLAVSEEFNERYESIYNCW